ncbi:hypothetical protein CJ030_MR0G007935 [Morella rubra]|uniref:Lon proteolytic domain-containing protein n=1 Tax=Morella rubra TaxID=262757 RepID=A0A6A1UJ44_9ROSI|nr:hypothetical protein CJ030_MR0G007935 [Morella rubra]
MEVIAIAGYITDEKMHIARDYLEKTTREACGIKPEQVEVTDAALLALIENYCREAGVRNLQKHIEKIYRKIALQLVRQGESNESAISGVQVVEPEETQVELTEEASERVVGSETGSDSVEDSSLEKTTETSVEAGTVTTDLPADQSQCPDDQPSDSKDVTEARKNKECETIARGILLEKEPDNPFFANSKLHLHVPSGATPKDGPSAGCTMITSLLSLAMKKPVKKDLAMTGEVTLTGKILPIGGVKEKTIAARRSDVRTIIFPAANRRDFDELAANVKEGLDVHFVDDYNQIFDIALSYDQNTEK